MGKLELEKKLVVGAKIKIGKSYSKKHSFEEGDIITLVEGHFEYDNGLFTEEQTAPSIKNEEGDYDSIYHLFGNELKDIEDCEVI